MKENCPKKELLVLFVAGELPPRRHRAIEAHLESCAACRSEVQHLARGLATMEHLEREPAIPPATLESLRHRLRAAAAHRSPRPTVLIILNRYRWVAAAAAVVLAAMTVIVWNPFRSTPRPSLIVENNQAEAIVEIAAAVELLESAENETGTDRTDVAPLDQNVEEMDLLLEMDDAGLLLEYLMSQENVRG